MRKKSRAASQESAVALFQDVVKPAPKGSGAARRSLSEWEVAGKLKELTENTTDIEEQFNIFRRDIWPYVKEMRGQAPKHVYLSTTQLLAKVRDAAVYKDMPCSSVEISQMLNAIGKWDLDIRNDLALNLCFNIIQNKNSLSTRIAMVRELVTLWQHISQTKRAGESEAMPHFVLPNSEEVLREIERQKGETPSTRMPRTTKMLSAMLPQYNPEQVRDIIPALLATLAVLSDGRFTSPKIQPEAAPLLHLVKLVLAHTEIDSAYINEAFDLRYKAPMSKVTRVKTYVVNQWSRAAAMLSKRDASWQNTNRGKTEAQDVGTFHKQLRTAYSSKNMDAIDSIWRDVLAKLETHPELAEQMAQDAQFLEYWIFVWCAVRRPQKMQQTFELMKQLGLQPTVRTYTAMMHGWKMCKDAAKTEALWSQLVQSGIPLDSVIWTERISSLIEGGQPQAGIQALMEMVAQWKDAVKNNRQSTAAAPTIESVNAALKGLLRLDTQAAHEVLGWAGREGFEPNTRTYNILLREAFRNDTPEEAQALLKAMRTHGIDPDSATFTIILEEVIGRMGDAQAAEQVQAVDQVFADIAAAGLRPTLETYGKMLYAVTGLENCSDEAVKAVLKHMRGHGFAITPHMVTILIERCLDRDPPDIAAVRALLKEHRLRSISQGDQTLWERVVSAFAITKETSAAMDIFNELADSGRPVTSLPCLTDLLKVLLETKDRENAQRVVSVVLTYKMKRSEDYDHRYWRHHFWFLARESGLLHGMQVPHVLRNL